MAGMFRFDPGTNQYYPLLPYAGAGVAPVAPSRVSYWDPATSSYKQVYPPPGPAFVKAASDTKDSGTNPSVTIDIAAGATLFIGTTTNSGITAVSMDGGTALTAYGQVLTTRIHQMFVLTGVAAGPHTFAMSGGGSWKTLLVAEYSGVTSVGDYTSKVSSTQVQTHTPTGSGKLAVALVASASVSSAAGQNPANYIGTLRHRKDGLSDRSLAWVDHTAAPLGLNVSGSAMSVGCMWLN
ncbi:minor tail protein [Gordonia phage Skog]|uniref:Minor tail protein n=1 Tax=Gordonia phage Skog TaxID=2704033 RepID=A0A6G6XJX3_9CAUD|nr:minor tail protein [Gordonia phage Skog]QIG58314.1 minor tail protein [Gordonia phage Skog]